MARRVPSASFSPVSISTWVRDLDDCLLLGTGHFPVARQLWKKSGKGGVSHTYWVPSPIPSVRYLAVPQETRSKRMSAPIGCLHGNMKQPKWRCEHGLWASRGVLGQVAVGMLSWRKENLLEE